MVNELIRVIKRLINENKFEKALQIIDDAPENEKTELLPYKAQIFIITRQNKTANQLITEQIEFAIHTNRLDLEFIYTVLKMMLLSEQFRFDEFDDYIQRSKNLLEQLKRVKLPIYFDFEASFYNVVGEYNAFIGDLKKAKSFYLKSQQIFEQNNSKIGIALSYKRIANLCLKQGKFSEAKKYLQSSLEIFKESKIKLAMANIMNDLGIVYWRLGNYENARNNFDIAFEIYSNLEYQYGVGQVFLNIGNIFRSQGELENALNYYNSSIEMFRKINSLSDETIALNNIGLVLQLKGDYQSALQYYIDSLEISEKINHFSLICSSLINLGTIYEILGDLKQSKKFYERALKLAKKQNSAFEIAGILENLGNVSYQMNNLSESLTYLQEALDIRRKLNNKVDLATNLYSLIMVYIARNENTEAEELISELSEIDEEVENRVIKLYSDFSNAIFYRASNRIQDKTKAQDLFKKIIDQEIIDANISLKSMIYYCEFLLDEYRLYHNQTVLEEINAIIKKLSKSTDEDKFPAMYVEILLLLSMFNLLQAEVEKADTNLKHAMDLVNKYKLTKLEQVTIDQRNKFEEFILNSDKIYKSSSYLRNQIEMNMVNNYIKNMIQMMNSEGFK